MDSDALSESGDEEPTTPSGGWSDCPVAAELQASLESRSLRCAWRRMRQRGEELMARSIQQAQLDALNDGKQLLNTWLSWKQMTRVVDTF
tara:strand:- start:370 stop:639 length:270 start_codon:yes stop_codon:yes gene_type:complete